MMIKTTRLSLLGRAESYSGPPDYNHKAKNLQEKKDMRFNEHFSPTMSITKEDYICSCTPKGKSKTIMSMSMAQRRKIQHNNMHLMEGMVMTDRNGFPVLQPFSKEVSYQFVPYSARKVSCPEDFCVHFFEDDYKFRMAMWDRLETTMYALRSYGCVMAPDHSLYIEEDRYGFLNRQSVFRSRFAGACMQLRGYDVIPTASWGGADSFEYCLEGLPCKSVIALCGIGIDSCRSSRELWEHGVREVEARLAPIQIIIYGKERKVPGLSTPTLFIPPYITTKMKKKKGGNT